MAGLNPLYPAPDKWRPGDNLLDNWYFAGGGSQLGWGHFPINQRGLTEYETPGGYAVDRWKFSGALITAKVDTEYITLRNNHQHRRGLTQFVDTGVASALKGRTVTVSALAKGTLQFAVGYTDTLAASASSDVFTSEDFELVNWTIENAPIESGLSVWLLLSQGQECSVIAAKLELGDQQTLAHKEGGRWVLNRVPDFREELAKCQAYQLKAGYQGGRATVIGVGYATSASEIWADIPTPVTMRATPTCTSSNIIVYGKQNGESLNSANIDAVIREVRTVSDNSLGIYIIPATESQKFVQGELYLIVVRNTLPLIIFDANL